MGANEFEQRRWNDERWVAVWPKRERLTDAISEYLLDAAALRLGERVLDIGCGGGKTSMAAARLVGGEGAVVGADLSVPLSELAERRAAEAGVDNVDFRVLDVQTDTIEGGPFDVAISQFGVMFFDEPITAFRNIRAHLKPGGRIAFACWQSMERNPWFFATAVAEFAPPPPTPAPGKSPTGPFALADPDTATHILQSAGFANVRRTAHQIEVEVPEDSVVDEAQLRFVGIPEDKLAAAQAAVDAHMQQFKLENGLSRFPLAYQLLQADNA
jgi:ubiquinone/menaquinone biosynthesis C-methylase UbiE